MALQLGDIVSRTDLRMSGYLTNFVGNTGFVQMIYGGVYGMPWTADLPDLMLAPPEIAAQVQAIATYEPPPVPEET